MFKKCIPIACFLSAAFLDATTAQWTGASTMPANNFWTNTGNWSPANVPNATGDIANLTSPTPSQTNISLNMTQITLTQLNLDLGTGYTIITGGGGGSFLFNGGNPSLNVTTANGNGTHLINPPIHVGAALSISQGSTGNLTFGGTINGGSNITYDGPGTLVLSQDSSGTYSGQFTIDTGTISVMMDNYLGPGTTNTNIVSGTLAYTGSDTTARPFTLSGSANINVSMGNLVTLNGVLSSTGSLTKGDAGSLRLNATNTYQGGTTISGGSLIITSDSNLGNTAGSLNIGTANLVILGNVTTARSGTISGNAAIISGGQNTFSGQFSGAGQITFSGGGEFTLTGANSYSNGTFIAGGTQVAGTTVGLQGNITLQTASSQLTFSQNFDGTYAGAISSTLAAPNGGAVTKLGTGTVTFTETSPFTGTTSINEGQLNVNGSLANSAVAIQTGGILGGFGTVGSGVNMGLIDPGSGSTIGSLTFNGPLMYMGGRTNINIAPLASDQIIVLNNAMISGPLQIDPVPAFYGFSAHYTILTSTGLAGTFGPVTSTNPSFSPVISYTGTSAILDVIISSPFAAFPFSNFNTEAVGHNIDALYAANQLSPDLLNIFNSFIGQSNAAINEALDQMHPAPYSGFTEMQAELDGQLISLFHRLPHLPCSCNNPSRLWVEGIGNTLTMKQHGLEIGFQANTGGLAFGYDGQINEYLVVGAGGAWSKSSFEWHDHRGKGDVNGLYGGAYLDTQVDGFYIGCAFLAGMDFYDTNRHMEFVTINRTAHAEFEALDLMSQISTAYLFGSPQAYFYPYANIDYLYLHTHKFAEEGAGGLNLNVFARTDTTLRSELGLGLQVQDRNAAETMCISPLASIGWVNMWPLQRPKLESTFEGASIPFEVIGWDKSWNLFNVNFALSIAYRCFSFKIGYNAEFSPDSHTILFNQHGNLRLDWKW